MLAKVTNKSEVNVAKDANILNLPVSHPHTQNLIRKQLKDQCNAHISLISESESPLGRL